MEFNILVHPFFDSVKNWRHGITHSAEEKIFRQQLYNDWELIAKKSKDNFITIYHPNTILGIRFLENIFKTGKFNEFKDQKELYEEILKTKEILDSHTLTINADLPQKDLKKIIYEKHNQKNITVNVFGEYEELCTKTVAKIIHEILKGRNHEVKVIKELCRHIYLTDFIKHEGRTYHRIYRTKKEHDDLRNNSQFLKRHLK